MRGGPNSRYVLASLALGAIAVWGSELLFWSAPTAPLGVFDLPLMLLAYGLASAAALSAVFLTRAQGLPAAFLGGCIMGWLVEGVVVATAYDAFPYQLVWTPMSWHGLLTGAALVAGWRWSVTSPLRMAVFIACLTAFGTSWALYWPLERTSMPGLPETATYLVGLGFLVPAGQILLDRLGPLERPPTWVIAIAPGLFAFTWLMQFALSLEWTRLALPIVIAATVLVLCRTRRADRLELGRVQNWSRHLWLLLVPAGIAISATTLWPITGGRPTNQAIAIATSVAALTVIGALLIRRPR
ncbi:MAG: hypothetical protein ACO1OG_06855 [Devosia sp.]